jgi:hypothetical protein
LSLLGSGLVRLDWLGRQLEAEWGNYWGWICAARVRLEGVRVREAVGVVAAQQVGRRNRGDPGPVQGGESEVEDK